LTFIQVLVVYLEILQIFFICGFPIKVDKTDSRIDLKTFSS